MSIISMIFYSVTRETILTYIGNSHLKWTCGYVLNPRHHALTNEIGVDEDIATDPVLFVRPPDPKNDSWHRLGLTGKYTQSSFMENDSPGYKKHHNRISWYKVEYLRFSHFSVLQNSFAFYSKSTAF